MNTITKFVKDQKVLPGGPDWHYDFQAKGAAYGVMVYLSSMGDLNICVVVHWIDYKGQVIDKNHWYRIGPKNFDLLEYED